MNSTKQSGLTRAEIQGRDFIESQDLGQGHSRIHFVGCEEFSRQVLKLKDLWGEDPRNWEVPTGSSHSSLLLREFILKIKGEFIRPYQKAELCHCRSVPTEMVEQAILCGAHTVEMVSRVTSASTACGTCRPDVEAILKARL